MSYYNGDVSLLPEWQELVSNHIDTGIPVDVVVRQDPRISFFADAGGVRIGVRLALQSDAPTSVTNLAVILVQIIKIGDARYLEVSTNVRDLYRDFYLLLGELLNEIVTQGAEPATALKSALSRWQSLLRAAALLSDERQLGLFGELWTLDRIFRAAGPAALDAWVGPLRQDHDFRLAANEFEVKSTSATRRTHLINGIGQLTPSTNCSLYLVSLQFPLAGASGKTLSDLVANLEINLKSSSGATERFHQLLELVGFRSQDSQWYPTRRRLGGLPRIVPVVAGCPRLTRGALSDINPDYAPDRIIDAHYRIDVDALGFEDGDPRFLAILPE
jgi:hypothetical protein